MFHELASVAYDKVVVNLLQLLAPSGGIYLDRAAFTPVYTFELFHVHTVTLKNRVRRTRMRWHENTAHLPVRIFTVHEANIGSSSRAANGALVVSISSRTMAHGLLVRLKRR